MMVADKTKLSPTVCAAVLQLGHEALPSDLEVARSTPVGARHWDRDVCCQIVQDALPRDFDRINVLQCFVLLTHDYRRTNGRGADGANKDGGA